MNSMTSRFTFDSDDLIGNPDVHSLWPNIPHDQRFRSASPEVGDSARQLHQNTFRDEATVHDIRYHAEVFDLDDVCLVLTLHEDPLLTAWSDYHESSHYFDDEELSAQLGMLPTPDEVSTVIGEVKVRDLREFAASIMNIAVDSAHKGYASLTTVRLLNGWFATMEEIIAAGDDLDEILSRRKKPRESRDQ